MAALTTQTILRSGITPTFAAVAASDTFTPGATVFVEVKNAGGSSDTVTIGVLAGDPSPTLLIADLSIAVGATTGDKMIGPFPSQFFADPTTGLTTIAHSFTTSVTCGVFNLQQP